MALTSKADSMPATSRGLSPLISRRAPPSTTAIAALRPHTRAHRSQGLGTESPIRFGVHVSRLGPSDAPRQCGCALHPGDQLTQAKKDMLTAREPVHPGLLEDFGQGV